jgi:hypothetical protein
MPGTASFELARLTTSNWLSFVPGVRRTDSGHFAACPVQPSTRVCQTRKKRCPRLDMLLVTAMQCPHGRCVFLPQGGDKKKKNVKEISFLPRIALFASHITCKGESCMTLTQQKQRMLTIIALLVLVSIVILGLISFEIAQHMNGIWQAFHGIAASPNILSRHP